MWWDTAEFVVGLAVWWSSLPNSHDNNHAKPKAYNLDNVVDNDNNRLLLQLVRQRATFKHKPTFKTEY